jgi:hypothetical protein
MPKDPSAALPCTSPNASSRERGSDSRNMSAEMKSLAAKVFFVGR